MAFAYAYLDESGTHDGAKDLCLAGYIFEEENALAFDRDWRLMLDKYQLEFHHMKEIALPEGKGGVYAHLDESQRDFSAREAIALIQLYAAQGLAISVDKLANEELRHDSPWENPYSFIAGQTVFGFQRWAEKAKFPGEGVYFFEAGADGAGQLADSFAKFKSEPLLKNEFRCKSITFSGKKDETPLQAADMLAWHTLKFNRNLRAGVSKKRGDFLELLKVPTDFNHYDMKAVDAMRAIRKLSPALRNQLIGLDASQLHK